jgi:hypothetical protein
MMFSRHASLLGHSSLHILETTRILLLASGPVLSAAWISVRRNSSLVFNLFIFTGHGVLTALQDAIPAKVGPTGLFSYASAFSYLRHAKDVVQRGYVEHREGVFRVPRLDRWDIIASGAKRATEITAAPEDVLSFYNGATDVGRDLIFRRIRLTNRVADPLTRLHARPRGHHQPIS